MLGDRFILPLGKTNIVFFNTIRAIEMKFHDLVIGQRFELDGAIYLKTSPVLASPEIGGSTKFMARYVAVRPLEDGRQPAQAENGRMIASNAVRGAFNAYHAACRQALTQLEGELPASRLESLAGTLEAARKDFLATLTP